MKSVTVVGNPVHGGELGRRGDVVEYSLPGYVATTDDQFFEIVAMAGHAGAVLVPRACHGCGRGYCTRLDAVRCHYSNVASIVPMSRSLPVHGGFAAARGSVRSTLLGCTARS